MIRKILLAGAGALVLLQTACLPSRDNAYDDVNRPEAALAIYVGTAGSANQGTRQSCFTLDATATDGEITRVEWDIDGVPGYEIANVPGDIPEPLRCGAQQADRLQVRLVLTQAELPSGVGSASRTIRVRAGNERIMDEAEGVAIVTNVAPVVDPGEDLFVPELTGGPVNLDACGGRTGACTSFDPDSDPLTFTWDLLRGTGVTLPASTVGTSLAFAAPLEEQTLLFRLTADDGLVATSRRVRVNVGTQVWVTTAGPTRVYRAFPEFRAVRAPFGLPGPEHPGGGVTVDEDGSLLAGYMVHDTNDLLVAGRVERSVITKTGLDLVQGWDAPGAFVPVSLASDGDAGCAVMRTHTSEILNFVPGSYFAGLLPDGSVMASDDSAVLGVEPKLVFAIPGGEECWAVAGALPQSPDAGAVFRLDIATGVLVDVTASPLLDVTAAAVDGAGNLVVAARVAGCAGSRLFSYPAAGGAPQPIGECIVDASHDAIAVDLDGSLFLHDEPTLGLFHFVDGTLAQLPTPELSLPYDGFFPHAEPGMTLDPLDRRLWLVEGFTGTMFRIPLDAESDAVSVSPPAFGGQEVFLAVALDPRTGMMIAPVNQGDGNTAGAIFQLPYHVSRVKTFVFGSPVLGLVPEPQRGDVWLGDSEAASPYPLRRLTQSGVTQARVALDFPVNGIATQVDAGAWAAGGFGTDSNNPGVLLRVDVDGNEVERWDYDRPLISVAGREGSTPICALRGVFGFGAELDLLRYEPGTDAMPVIDDSSAAPLTASRSAATPDGACWFSHDSGLIRWDGTTRNDIGATIMKNTLDVDPATSEAYIVTLSTGSASTPAIVRVAPNGAMTDFRGSLGELFLDVQRLCGATCEASDPLQIWVVRGELVERIDGETALTLDSYFLPETGDMIGLWVLP